MHRRFMWIVVLVSLVLVLPSAAWPQGGETGAILGQVVDQQGGGIPNAKIIVISRGTGAQVRQVSASGTGAFAVNLLPPGTYSVEISAPSFAKYVINSVIVRVTETTSVKAVMKLGAVTETVSVVEAATPINVVNATTGQSIMSETIANLPALNRNFLTLLNLSAGANGEMLNTASVLRGEVSMNVNGQRPTNNNYQLEGINANDVNLPIFDNVPLPNPNSIEEFKTQTSLYDASQGRNGGGNIQAVIKSGTDKYHGDLFGYLRNTIFDANDFFLNSGGQKRPVVRQGQFGSSISGPIPLIGKNLFFFFNYQGTRAASGQAAGTNFSTSIPIVPANRSAANLAAIFGVPAASINPVALAVLNLPASKCPGFNDGSHCYPTLSGTPGPNPAGGVNTATITRAALGTFFENQFTGKVDKQLGARDRVTGSIFTSNFHQVQPFGGASTLPFQENFPNTNRFAKVGWTHTLSDKAVNDARFGFSRFTFSRQPVEPVSLADIGATRANSAQFPGMYEVRVTANFTLGEAVNDDRGGHFNTFYGADDYTHTLGNHTLRAGFDISRYQLNRFNNFATRGSVTFNDFGGLNAFQNFLEGNVTTTQAEAGFSSFAFRALDAASYFQDDWKFSRRLTINMGVRWEGLSTANEKNNFLSNFRGLGDPSGVSTISIIHPAGTPRVGTPGVSGCTLTTCFNWKNFAPRLGFAWDVTGDQKFVVRGGYGIYFQRVSNQSLLQTAGGLPFAESISADPLSVTMQNPFPSILPSSAFPLPVDQVVPALIGFCAPDGTNPITGAVGPPCVGTAASGAKFPRAGRPIYRSSNFGPLSGFFFFPERSLRPPYAEQWNFTVQHELVKRWVLEVGYVGTLGVHLLGTGRPLNPGQICTITRPCVIPASIGANVVVPAGTPGVTANPDGTIAISDNGNFTTDTLGASHFVSNINARVPSVYTGLANSRGFFQENAGHSIYHSLQATLSHQWASGLYLQGAYTYSKTIDNGSGSTFSDELNGLFQFGDLFNPNSNKGMSDFDRTHRLVVSYNYELPFAKMMGISNHGFGKIVNGWTVSGITLFQSGTPFVVVDSSALLLEDTDGVNATNYAQLAPGANLSNIYTSGPMGAKINNYINLNQFVGGGTCVNPQNVIVSAASATCTGFTALGTLGRNRLRGPFQQNWDISVGKTTAITERVSVEFRAEFLNAFNHPAFQSPQFAGGSFGNYGYVDLASGTSSILSTVNGPRIMQFALIFRY